MNLNNDLSSGSSVVNESGTVVDVIGCSEDELDVFDVVLSVLTENRLPRLELVIILVMEKELEESSVCFSSSAAVTVVIK